MFYEERRLVMNYYPAISFVAPYRIYIPDRFFKVKLESFSAQVKAVPLPTTSHSNASQAHGANVEIIHDIFGFAGRTQFYTLLDSQPIDIYQQNWEINLSEKDHFMVDLSLQAVNRLLAVYRDRDINQIGIKSFHVIELVRGDLSNIELVVVDEELNQMSDFAVIWPGYRTMGFGQSITRTQSVILEFEDYLNSNTSIPIERELISSAQNHLWRGQYRLSPVEANTAFEAFALSALQKIDPTTTIPDTSEMITKLEALYSALATIAKNNSKLFPNWFSGQGWKGLINPELKQWHFNCYILRNKIIHRGYNSVQMDEAKLAVESVINAMNFIEKCIVDVSKK